MGRLLTQGSLLTLLAWIVVGNRALASERSGTTSVDFSAFRNCVDHVAKSTFERSVREHGETILYGYQTDVENKIITICDPSLNPESTLDSSFTANPKYKYVNLKVEALVESSFEKKARMEVEAHQKQQELDAPKRKAEEEASDSAIKAYYACLVRHAQALALASREPAETIAKATFPSCYQEKQLCREKFQIQYKELEARLLDEIESKFERTLLLEIIKIRVQPVPSQSPANADAPS